MDLLASLRRPIYAALTPSEPEITRQPPSPDIAPQSSEMLSNPAPPEALDRPADPFFLAADAQPGLQMSMAEYTSQLAERLKQRPDPRPAQPAAARAQPPPVVLSSTTQVIEAADATLRSPEAIATLNHLCQVHALRAVWAPFAVPAASAPGHRWGIVLTLAAAAEGSVLLVLPAPAPPSTLHSSSPHTSLSTQEQQQPFEIQDAECTITPSVSQSSTTATVPAWSVRTRKAHANKKGAKEAAARSAVALLEARLAATPQEKPPTQAPAFAQPKIPEYENRENCIGILHELAHARKLPQPRYQEGSVHGAFRCVVVLDERLCVAEDEGGGDRPTKKVPEIEITRAEGQSSAPRNNETNAMDIELPQATPKTQPAPVKPEQRTFGDWKSAHRSKKLAKADAARSAVSWLRSEGILAESGERGREGSSGDVRAAATEIEHRPGESWRGRVGRLCVALGLGNVRFVVEPEFVDGLTKSPGGKRTNGPATAGPDAGPSNGNDHATTNGGGGTGAGDAEDEDEVMQDGQTQPKEGQQRIWTGYGTWEDGPGRRAMGTGRVGFVRGTFETSVPAQRGQQGDAAGPSFASKREVREEVARRVFGELERYRRERNAVAPSSGA